MTHILDFAKPNRSFLLFKPDRHHVREGDTVIFQSKIKKDLGDGASFEDINESSVMVTYVDIGGGLKMGYQLIGWSETK